MQKVAFLRVFYKKESWSLSDGPCGPCDGPCGPCWTQKAAQAAKQREQCWRIQGRMNQVPSIKIYTIFLEWGDEKFEIKGRIKRIH